MDNLRLFARNDQELSGSLTTIKDLIDGIGQWYIGHESNFFKRQV